MFVLAVAVPLLRREVIRSPKKASESKTGLRSGTVLGLGGRC